MKIPLISIILDYNNPGLLFKDETNSLKFENMGSPPKL
jgi:hypothetical protein